MKLAITLAAVALAGTTASAELAITELYTGLSGPHGTADWIEITNTGASTVDTGAFFYDDSNPNSGDWGQLDSIMLAAGESAIFLQSNDAADIAEFNALWSYSGHIGLTNGGGGLGQGSDGAYLLDSMENIISSAEYGDGIAGMPASVDFSSGSPVLSVLGVNGAYESASFTNDNFPGETVSLVASVGVVPTPGSAALLALGGLLGARRRRA